MNTPSSQITKPKGRSSLGGSARGSRRTKAIFESLARGEAAVKNLTARFDISQPAVSQHLATRKEAGLVHDRREGRSVYYTVE